jgi:hypothetical protein
MATTKKRPTSCECDNGHEQAGTCCMPCWRAGFRVVPADPKAKRRAKQRAA